MHQNYSMLASKVKYASRNSFKRGIKAYSTSFLAIGVMVPVVASLIEVIVYLTLQNSTPPPLLGFLSNPQWYTLLYSSFLTGILWLVAAVPFCFLSTAQGANPHNYNLLRSRLHQLKVALGMKDYANEVYEEIDTCSKVMKEAGFDEHNKHHCAVLKEAYACCIDVSRKLHSSPAGLSWIIGSAYNSAWALLHHAEEVMIEVADVETAVRAAKHDFLAIQDSELDRKDELLDDVLQAVAVLKPEALAYFKEHQPGKGGIGLQRQTQLINTSSDQSSTVPGAAHALAKKSADANARAKAEAVARVMLREVRSTLNDFRDKRMEGLVRQRSRLLLSIVVTGIVTHALLCMTILTSPQPVAVAHQQFTSFTPTQSGILAAAMFYLVGAVAGLFVRFYYESRGSSSVDDFGLSTTRLAAIPLLSGLAGIGGVLIAEMLAALGGPALIGSGSMKPIELSALFSLDPRLLLTAAIFGVTPNLVIKGLQETADEYAAELQSSKAAETRVVGAKARGA